MSLKSRYDRIFHSLSRVELQTGTPEFDLPDLFGAPRENRWLGFYTEEGLRIALERYGLFERLAEIGYTEVQLELKYDDPDEHLFRVYSAEPCIPGVPLIELVARRDVVRPDAELAERLGVPYVGVLHIEWLQLQRPNGLFTRERPPLPGQQFPGLGIGREILELLRLAAKRLGLEALVTVPSWFHNAYFYSIGFQYMDPEEQGTFLALCRDLLPEAEASVAAVSWAISEGLVTDENGAKFEWFHDIMMAPLSDGLKEYVSERAYHAESGESLRRTSYSLDMKKLSQRLAELGVDPLDRGKIDAWIGDGR